MPSIIVKELSRENSTIGESSTRERHYKLWSSFDTDEIEAALLSGTNAYTDGAGTVPFAGVPGSIGSLVLRTSKIDADEESKGDIWDAVVTWGDRKFPSVQQQGQIRTYSRAGIRMVKVRESRSTVGQYPASWFNGGSAHDFKGLVGVNRDGTVEGVDVPEPYVIYGVRAIVSTSTVTDSYEVAAQGIVGKLNSTVYRNRAARTLRAESVAFNYVDDDNTEITAEFGYSEHINSMTIGGITGIAKEAWDYLWPYKVTRKEGDQLLPSLAQINVERNHETANFASALGF